MWLCLDLDRERMSSPGTGETMPPVLFRCRLPRPPLDGFVELIWLCHNEPQAHALERILPTGAAQLIVNLKEDRVRRYDPDRGHRCETTCGTVLAAVQSRYSVIDTAEQEHVMGVVFKPGGTVPFMRVPAHATCDADVPLDLLWDRRQAATLRERLLEPDDPEAKLDALEQALLEAWHPVTNHPAVAFALRMFQRRPPVASVGAVTDAVGLSAKRFIERFKTEVGLTPKQYLPHRAISTSPQGRALRRPDRLAGARRRLRLLRSGALRPRLSRVHRAESDGVPGGTDGISEPRQILTRRFGPGLTRSRHDNPN